jgi:signal transduction histidine kinase
MRRRLVRLTVLVAVVATALLGIPLGVAGVLFERRHAQEALDNAAFGIGRQVEDRLGRDELLSDEMLSRLPAEYAVEVEVAPSGRRLSSGRDVVGPALRASYVTPQVNVSVEQSASTAYSSVRTIVLIVGAAALVAVVAAVALGHHQADRLAMPLVDLARSAERLGSGESASRLRRYGLPEVDRVIEMLERSSERVSRLIASERQFASDASHQLRTPLTALSMRLEEILNTDDPEIVREEARVALGQLERLSAVVDHLLDNARATRSATARAQPVDRIIRQQVEEWRPAYDAAGRRIAVTGVAGLRGCATPGGLAQVIATLLENSLVHGGGTTMLRTRTTGMSVVIEVTDQGPGIPEELGASVFERSVSGRSGTGLGLALARDLAVNDGGRLELVQQKPAVFALFLPAMSGEPGYV